jgi:hypothetical protein
MALKLEVTRDGHRHTVSFSTEDQALAYVGARIKTYYFDLLSDLPESWTRLGNMLYPKCHHGMDESMCMDPIGPHHFGTAEWERQQYGGW